MSETIGQAARRLLAKLERPARSESRVIHLPQTAAGRQNLREALTILRNCGPAPKPVAGADWDDLPDGAA